MKKNIDENKGKLGVILLTLFVTGTIVGSGVYMLPAALAGYGSIGLVAWIAVTIGAIFLALIFAHMSTVCPITGGPYTYTHKEFGDYPGFQTAYCYWISAFVGNTSLLPPTIGYLAVFFPGVRDNALIVSLILVWIFAGINIIGVKKVGFVNAVMTVLKFMPIVIVALFAWKHFHPSYITSNFNVTNQSSISIFTIAAALTLWSFVGVEAATVPAGSVINPKKTIPIATITGTLVAAVAYIITCTAIMGMIPMQELSQCTSPFSVAGTIILGKFGEVVVTIGVLFSLLSGVNAWTLLASQVAMAAADDGLFPAIFSKRNKFDVPVFGIVITTTLVSILLIMTSSLDLIEQFEIFILSATSLVVIPYLFTSFAQIIFLFKNRDTASGFYKNMIIAIIGGIFSFFALFSAGEGVIFYVMIFLLLNVPLYAIVLCGRHKKNNKS